MKKTGKYEKSTFAKNVIKLRNELGFSAIKFAEKAEIPYPTLRDIESGRTSGSTRNRKLIAKALNTTVDALNTPPGLMPIHDIKAIDLDEIENLKLFNRALTNRVKALELEIDSYMSQKEKLLIDSYRASSTEKQGRIDAILGLSATTELLKKKNK